MGSPAEACDCVVDVCPSAPLSRTSYRTRTVTHEEVATPYHGAHATPEQCVIRLFPVAASEGVVADGEGGGEDAEDEEGLRGRLVLDVVGDGVLQEGDLREHLREDEGEEDGGKRRLADQVEVGGDRELGDVCLLYTSPSPRDRQKSRMPSSA